MTINIVLVEPEIPQNAGNIVRTCAATGALLHMIKPLGFSVEDRYLKRAGLDYWDKSRIFYYENLQEFMCKFEGGNFYFASTKAKRVYSEVEFKDGDFIFFGKESQGLSEVLLEENYASTIRIPMLDKIRSLNLSNSVAIVLYEALRQNNFENFCMQGKLTGRGY